MGKSQFDKLFDKYFDEKRENQPSLRETIALYRATDSEKKAIKLAKKQNWSDEDLERDKGKLMDHYQNHAETLEQTTQQFESKYGRNIEG